MSDTDSSSGTPPPAPSRTPYEILNLPATATATEIRSAYRKLALTVHPDKVPATERDTAHLAFQELTFAYGILSDETRRKRYDETGSTSEDGTGDGFNWKEFYKAQTAELITEESIKKFKEEYRGSDEERAAVLDAYIKSKGSMSKIFENVMCSEVLDDEGRFTDIINEAIASGGVEAFRNFTAESKASKKQRRAQAEGEKREAEEYAKELGVHDELFGDKKAGKTKGKKAKAGEDVSGLMNLIQRRANNRMDELVANLEAKYASKPKKGKGGGRAGSKRKNKATDENGEEVGRSEPTEEEFQAVRKRMEGKKSKVVEDDGSASGLRRSKRVRR